MVSPRLVLLVPKEEWASEWVDIEMETQLPRSKVASALVIALRMLLAGVTFDVFPHQPRTVIRARDRHNGRVIYEVSFHDEVSVSAAVESLRQQAHDLSYHEFLDYFGCWAP
jgi:hypothetical protein